MFITHRCEAQRTMPSRREGVPTIGPTSIAETTLLESMDDYLGAGQGVFYLCYSLTLVMNSGQEISFSSDHHDWRGHILEYIPAQYYLIRSFTCFRHGGRGYRHSVWVTSIHLPLSLKNAQYLPTPHQQMLKFLLMVARRRDDESVQRGDCLIGTDVWWLVINFLVGHDLQPSVARERELSDFLLI